MLQGTTAEFLLVKSAGVAFLLQHRYLTDSAVGWPSYLQRNWTVAGGVKSYSKDDEAATNADD